MRIREVTLEGFKSYNSRITIGPFHEQFNAITGPNGTGKSNVFDGICFAMGFKPGEQMRVSTIDELIYKRGQAGTSSAAVTVVFDNDDLDTSPPIYAGSKTITVTRQISIGGRDRFFVNGSARKLTEVVKLFQEARLNVHRPHFIVMQGRISKVISMRPMELLELFQEAVGTNAFDQQRAKSEKTLVEKQERLAEIQSDINDNLGPILEAHRKDRQRYQAYMKLVSHLPCMQNLWLMKRKECSENIIKTRKELLRSGEHELDLKDKSLIEAKNGVEDLKADVKRKAAAKNDVKLNIELQNFQEQLEPILKSLNEAEGAKLVAASALKRGEEDLRRQEKIIIEKKDRLATFESRNSKSIEKEETAKTAHAEAQRLCELARQKLDQGKRGNWLTDNGALLSEVVAQLKSEKNNLENERSALSAKLGKREEIVRSLTKSANSKGELSTQLKNLQVLESRLKLVVEKLETFPEGIQSEKLISLRTELNEQQTKRDDLESQSRKLGDRFGQLERLIKAFPQDQVLGHVVDLIEVKEEHTDYCLAIEEAAKARLLNVVVSDHNTSARIFKWGREQNVRITALPIGDIHATPLPVEVVQKAKKCGRSPDDVLYGMELIDIVKPETTNCICSIFNTYFFAKDSDTALKVYRQDKWIYPTVAKDGSFYNPQGLLSGGSDVGMGRFIESRKLLKPLLNQIDRLDKDIHSTKQAIADFLRVEEDFKKQQSEKEKIETAMETTQAQIDTLKVTSDEGRLHAATEEISKLREQLATIDARLKELMKELKPNEMQLNRCRSNAPSEVSRLEKECLKCESEVKKSAREIQQICEESKSTREERLRFIAETHAAEAEIQRIQVDVVQTAQKQLDCQVSLIAELTKEKETLEAKMDSHSKAKIILIEELQMAEQKLVDAETHYENLKSDIDQLKSSLRSAAHDMDTESKTLVLVNEESRKMGALDPTAMKQVEKEYGSLSRDDLKSKLEELNREKSKLQMTISATAESAATIVEQKFAELKSHQAKVEEERDTVIRLIENIDEQKKKKLDTSFTKVDKLFGQIFSTLLPGANSSLSSIKPNDDLSAGIEMVVSLSGLKKQSLSDLSGGQKSLLALSLILAMLKLNPAPFYILDEVDAALDLSHTQNLGNLIKRYFSESQFIIISHKDNLYDNADVLFRTSFENGTSKVTRIAARR